MIKEYKKSKRGFTIVETLVAVAILMIAIAGPLVVSSKAYTAAIDAKNQTIAYNLAQESMEEIKNWKDNNIDNFNSLLELLSVAPVLDTDGKVIGLPASCASYNCRVYLDSDGVGYVNNNDTVEETIFSRYVDTNLVGSNSDETMVTVTVSWKTGTVGNQVQIRDLMTNATI